jgi:hypothetical protein
LQDPREKDSLWKEEKKERKKETKKETNKERKRDRGEEKRKSFVVLSWFGFDQNDPIHFIFHALLPLLT